MNYNKKSGESQSEIQKVTNKKRYKNLVASWMEKHLTEAAFLNFEHCGDYVVMLENETRDKQKLDVAYFCKQRLCPACAWRSAVKSAQSIAAVAGAMAELGREMLMVTLTVPNVAGSDLDRTIRHINSSFTKMLKRKRYVGWADGIRKMEVTYNRERNDYHPHLHIIVFVKKGYFKGKGYVSRKNLLKDWQKATGQEEITQVDIRRCYDKDGSNAILEVAKYSAKASDYSISEEVFDTMYRALHNKRLLTYFGKCSEFRDDYKAGKLERFEQIDTTIYTMRVVYMWQKLADAYEERECKPYEMSPEELNRVQRDEQRLATLAIAKANRIDEHAEWTKDWNAYSWVRIAEQCQAELLKEDELLEETELMREDEIMREEEFFRENKSFAADRGEQTAIHLQHSGEDSG